MLWDADVFFLAIQLNLCQTFTLCGQLLWKFVSK
jgi:hypothetical protein